MVAKFLSSNRFAQLLSFLSSTSSDYHPVDDWQALSGFGVVLFLYTKRQACTIPRITL